MILLVVCLLLIKSDTITKEYDPDYLVQTLTSWLD